MELGIDLFYSSSALPNITWMNPDRQAPIRWT
jgi:hypothetical protein